MADFEFCLTIKERMFPCLVSAQCKDSALNSETFMAAVRSCEQQRELEQVELAAAREVEGLKKRGVSDSDKQKLASLEVVMRIIKNQMDGRQV